LVLARRFTLEEVKNALFSMAPNKAPGPDNIPIEFYQHCCEHVKWDIMKLFHAFHARCLDVSRLKWDIITLLPKILVMIKLVSIDLFVFICAFTS
jgi:hypothetical protein